MVLKMAISLQTIKQMVFKDIAAINGDILFMGVRDLTVKKQNGETKVISLPEDITIKAIETDNTSLITPRSYAVIGSVIEGGPAENNGPVGK